MTDPIDAELDEICRGTVAVETRRELERKWQRCRESGTPLRIKLGVDPTCSDLHLGHTVQLRKIRQFQEAGHLGVLIIGDYTACVGDPSGRNKTRPTLSHEEVKTNAATYLEQAWKVLDRERTEVVHNGDWFRPLEFLDTIALCSRMTVARLLERDDFKKRYQALQSISLHEFLYPLMQGYDSVQVRADVELGGTDQTFNLLVGRDFMRQEGMEPQVCMTLPLLVGIDGAQKMSKSYGNAIAISEESEIAFGKTMSIPDAAMRDYFVLCTDHSLEEIDALLSGNPRDAKAALARRIVEMYHGEEAADVAEDHFNRIFRDREEPERMEAVVVPRGALVEGSVWIVDLIVRAGLASKNNEARRKVEGGGVRVDGVRIEDVAAQVSIRDGAVLQVGKKHFRRVRIE
ncbi:MAG: tyrosine--tRNA ligase [Planctomycetota bacterium]